MKIEAIDIKACIMSHLMGPEHYRKIAHNAMREINGMLDELTRLRAEVEELRRNQLKPGEVRAKWVHSTHEGVELESKYLVEVNG